MADNNSSTPATPTITTSSTDNAIPLVALTSGQLPLKLTHLNYPSWRAQFNSLLLGYDLHGFIDGTHTCPLIGDGTGLRISHFGSTTLSPFTLSNVLRVPSIQKNLVSVSQFCKQHLTSIEFFPSHFMLYCSSWARLRRHITS